MARPMFEIAETVGDLVQAYSEGNINIAHCVSADFRIGAGIAKVLDKKFGIRRELEIAIPPEIARIGNVVALWRDVGRHQRMILNLITKQNANDKPTYADFSLAVMNLKKTCEMEELTELSIPRMGCGLDRLEWPKVRDILEETFSGMPGGFRFTVFRLAP